jgi:hypothetical protein
MYYVVLCGTMWYYVVLCGTMWYYVVLCGTKYVVSCSGKCDAEITNTRPGKKNGGL